MAFTRSTKRQTMTRKTTDLTTVLVRGVRTLIGRRSTPWTGTMTELSAALTRVLGRRVPSNWPASPSALRVVLNRVIGRIRAAGVSVRFRRSRQRTVTFVR